MRKAVGLRGLGYDSAAPFPRGSGRRRGWPAVLSFFVADVSVSGDGALGVSVSRFSSDGVWFAEYGSASFVR